MLLYGLRYFFFLKLLQLVCQFLVMADLKEECACVKVCFLLAKMAVVTVIVLETAYKEDATGKHKFMVVFRFQK